MALYKVIGSLAHSSRPKNRIDVSMVIEARDIIQAMRIYKTKKRGVKKKGLFSIIRLGGGV